MNLSARLRPYPRVTIAAFLTILAFAIPAVIQTVTADAAPSATSAKKKCKKGYKKVKGKCKKKTAAKKKTSAIVSSVTIRITDRSIYKLDVAGEVITKTPQTSIAVKVIAACGSFHLDKTFTATGDGTSTTLTYKGDPRNPATAPAAPRKCKTTVEAIADGVSSGAISN